MALITCPRCGNKVSDKAKSCMRCGMPVAEMIIKGETPIAPEHEAEANAAPAVSVTPKEEPLPSQESETQSEQKGKDKKIVFGIILFIVLLTIGATAYFICNNDVEAQPENPNISMPVAQSVEENPKSNVKAENNHTKTNEHDFVDLGLSVKWATCNIGAKNPEDSGSYFAWGEIKSKSEYTAKNSQWYKKDTNLDIAGNSSYDVARAEWGGTWRLPTKAEIQELVENCSVELIENEGGCGYMATSKINGNSIFFPTGGWIKGTKQSKSDSHGCYWSSTPDTDNTEMSFSLIFYNNKCMQYWSNRFSGINVRPVSE